MILLADRAASTLVLSIAAAIVALPLWFATLEAERILTERNGTVVEPEVVVTEPLVEAEQVVDIQGLSPGSSYLVADWVPVPLPNFKRIVEVKKKKLAFFDYLYPIILNENKVVLEVRWRLMRQLDWTLPQHADWLRAVAESYGLEPSRTVNELRIELLTRIDIVPPSIAMAQAAKESLWGTTRFAVQGNNLFNLWCHVPGCGIVPSNRSRGSNYEVQKYSNVGGAVAAYIHKLNSDRNYAELRRLRRVLREELRPILGTPLAQGLSSYSPRGSAYVEDVLSMLRINNLDRYDQQMLNDLAPLLNASNY